MQVGAATVTVAAPVVMPAHPDPSVMFVTVYVCWSGTGVTARVVVGVEAGTTCVKPSLQVTLHGPSPDKES